MDMSIDSDSEDYFSCSDDDSYVSVPSLGDTLKSRFSGVPNNFNVVHLNAQSIPAHFSDMLANLDCKNIHAILVSESWLKPSLPSTSYSLPGFILIRNDRSGVAIYLRAHIPYSVVHISPQPPPSDAGEHLFLEVELCHTKTLLGVYYCPSQHINFFNSFERLLHSLTPSYSQTIIMGDFNTCLLKNDSRSSSLRSVSIAANLNILQLNATHYPPNNAPTLLDLIIVSSLDRAVVHGQCSADGFSCHDLLFLSYKIRPPKAKSRILMHRNFSSMDPNLLREDAKATDQDPIYSENSVDKQVEMFVAILSSLFNKHAPIRSTKPERLISPYTTIVRRSGNPFELATVCVSWLIGTGYDAYIVVGCAKRDTCMAIRYRTECPDIPDETEVIEEPLPPEEEPRYRLVPLPDFSSKYCDDMKKKEDDKKQAEIDKIENQKLKKIADLEKPPPDDIDGWRTHAWILVLPGFMGVEEPFFIEPSEGKGYPLNAEQYQHIESVYNHENYYANIQDQSISLDSLNYDLADLSCWEHLLAGEPTYRRQLVGIDTSDKRTVVETERHLDMPPSWVEKLDIITDEFEQRYPGSHKVIHYKKVLLEKFSPYSQPNGIVKRIQIFEDYALSQLLLTYEWYQNRRDNMITSKTDHTKREVHEEFLVGRIDHLLKHTYSMDAPVTSVEGNRVLEFNYYARLDHLKKIVCTPLTFEEHYTDREDRLESREIIYTEGNKTEPKRAVKDITEIYRRNPDVPAKKDIWKQIFHMQENTIQLQYHYAYNFVTNDTRHFIKPNLAETGGKILFYPDKTSGYIADPCAELPRPLDVYYALCENMDREYKSNKHIRDRETDINGYLRQRHKELTEPMLYVALFDTERNTAAKKGWKEQEAQKAEVTEREKEAEIDPLAPYLARMFGSGHGSGVPLTVKEATLVREQCINDFKARQLARQNLVQGRFDKYNSEYKAKRLWYLANQFILTPEKESAYFATSAELAFKVHSLEVRLTRHRDLSGPRFKAMMDYLDKHPLLKEYNMAKQNYRSLNRTKINV